MESKVPAFAYITQELQAQGVGVEKSTKVHFAIDYADTESIQGVYFVGSEKFQMLQIWTPNGKHLLASVTAAMLTVHRDIFTTANRAVTYQNVEGLDDLDSEKDRMATYYAPVMLCVLNSKVVTDFEQSVKQLNDWCYEWGGLRISFVFKDLVHPDNMRLHVYQRVTPQSILSKAKDGVTGLVRRMRGRDAYLN